MGRWRQLPVAAVCLGIAGLLTVGAVYLLNYQQRETYIVSRNLRLLGVLARQTERAIDAAANRFAAQNRLDARTVTRRIDLRHGRSTVTLTGASGALKENPPTSETLGHVFEPKLRQGAFDTIALVAPDGTVALAVGRREWEISSMGLGALLRVQQAPAATPAGGSPSATSASPGVPDRITVIETDLAGVPYEVFVQPCCQGVSFGSTQARGAVVVGLATTEAVNREAMAISPALVLVGLLLVALVFLAWPFLNVALQGPRKRLTLWDALPLGFSGVVGLSIATLLAITTVQCTALERDGEWQLEQLAAEIDRDLSEEILRSSATLTKFVDWLSACPQGAGVAVEPGCRADSGRGRDRGVYAISEYSVAALINKQGKQIRKTWPSREPPPLVDVQDRAYFQVAIRRASSSESTERPTPVVNGCLAAPCVLESLVSYTTGEPSAVLARPSGIQTLPVAAITLPMRSVINPALPPGFEFAVIEKTGRVIFHSDVQRNTFEDLILETDNNPTLRSLIAAGLNGTVRMDYWGRPYLAHVRHAGPFGWAIVTLLERQHLRSLTLEWSMVSVFLIGAYALLWTIALCGIIATKPAWLWPDRFRHWRYFLLAVCCLALLAGFAVAAVSPGFSRSMLGAAGFLLPLTACLIAVLLLKRPSAAVVGTTRLDLRLDYCVPGAFFLIAIGVLPGAAFVMRAYDANVEAYLKHRQLGVVQALGERQSLKEVLPPCGLPGWTSSGWHSRFFYGMTLCLDDGAAQKVAGSGSGHSEDPDRWWLLEAYVPYFSETSVQLRELVHRHADDGSWTSERQRRELILRVPHPAAGPGRHVKATTNIPTLAIADIVWALLGAAAILAALAYGITYFIAHYLFLGRVSPPSWALGRLAIPEGTTVVLAGDPAAIAPRIHGARPLALLRGPEPASVEAGLSRVAAQLADIDAACDPVVITDLTPPGVGAFEVASSLRLAAALAQRKTHALLLLSTHPLPELADALASTPSADRESLVGVKTAIAEFPDDVIELDWRTHPGAATGPLKLSVVQGLQGRLRRLSTRLRRRAPEDAGASRPAAKKWFAGELVVSAEERAHPGLRRIGADIRRLDAFRGRRLTRDELFEEFAEAAEGFYIELWDSCTDEEKLELFHIAQFGVAHPGNGRAVRQLIGKRLVSKDPELCLMNRTFTRFVLASRREGSTAQADLERIENALSQSAWDRFRLPFALLVTGVALFLFITQRDTYNVTVGAAVSLATQLPNILKALTIVAQKDPVAAASRNA